MGSLAVWTYLSIEIALSSNMWLLTQSLFKTLGVRGKSSKK
jgi:hypothetical protein